MFACLFLTFDVVQISLSRLHVITHAYYRITTSGLFPGFSTDLALHLFNCLQNGNKRTCKAGKNKGRHDKSNHRCAKWLQKSWCFPIKLLAGLDQTRNPNEKQCICFIDKGEGFTLYILASSLPEISST